MIWVLILSKVSSIKRDGYNWYPYRVEFESPDGIFSFALLAISDEHAHLQVEAIRESAHLAGKLYFEGNIER